jgi:hypothetical protein
MDNEIPEQAGLHAFVCYAEVSFGKEYPWERYPYMYFLKKTKAPIAMFGPQDGCRHYEAHNELLMREQKRKSLDYSDMLRETAGDDPELQAAMLEYSTRCKKSKQNG